MNKFESRLSPKIQRELRVLRPSGLGQAMELVQMIEEKLSLISYKAKASRITSIQTNWKSQISAAKEGPPSRTTTPMRNPRDGIRFEVCQQILSSKKTIEGLYYLCDEKFLSGIDANARNSMSWWHKKK